MESIRYHWGLVTSFQYGADYFLKQKHPLLDSFSKWARGYRYTQYSYR